MHVLRAVLSHVFSVSEFFHIINVVAESQGIERIKQQPFDSCVSLCNWNMDSHAISVHPKSNQHSLSQ